MVTFGARAPVPRNLSGVMAPAPRLANGHVWGTCPGTTARAWCWPQHPGTRAHQGPPAPGRSLAGETGGAGETTSRQGDQRSGGYRSGDQPGAVDGAVAGRGGPGDDPDD